MLLHTEYSTQIKCHCIAIRYIVTIYLIYSIKLTISSTSISMHKRKYTLRGTNRHSRHGWFRNIRTIEDPQ